MRDGQSSSKRRIEMNKEWVRGIGIGLVAVALGCTGADSADTEITGKQGEIRSGFPIANP